MTTGLGVLALMLASTGAEPARVLVAIANNVGDPGDPPLRFAHADAERVQALFVDIGGVSADRAYLVLNQPAAVVREKLAEVAGRIAELAAAGKDVVLILYVSAHAKNGSLHLSGTRLPLAELRDYSSRSHARLRLVIVDACDSGAIARAKGGAPGPEYQVALEQLPLAGQVLISSSGPTESSQEWDALGGSLFTHHLLTGLRGDADADENGTVSLGEAYGYAFRRTVVQAEGNTQHPGFDLDLRGAGELVLSQPGKATSAVLFPAGLSGRYVLASQPRPDVVAEIAKRAGKVLRLAVAPGRYVVRKYLGRAVGTLVVELPYGGQRTIEESQLVWRDYLEVSSKGGDYVDPLPASVVALGSVGSAQISGTGARWKAGLGYRPTRGEWWGLAGVTAGATRYRGRALTTFERSAQLELSVGYRWLRFSVVPIAGLTVEVLGLEQSYRRDEEDEIQRIFNQSALPPRTTIGLSAGPVVGVELPIVGGLFGLVQLRGLARYLPAQRVSAVSFGIEAQLGLGLRF